MAVRLHLLRHRGASNDLLSLPAPHCRPHPAALRLTHGQSLQEVNRRDVGGCGRRGASAALTLSGGAGYRDGPFQSAGRLLAERITSSLDDTTGPLSLSEFEALTVFDAAGENVGDLIDVVATLQTDPPLVKGFFVQSAENEQLFVRWDQVRALDLDDNKLELSVQRSRLAPSSLRPDELALVDAVLDKQVLDIRNRKFVRVQDVTLEPRGADLAVAGVDASGGAVMRRMGLGFLSRRLGRRESDFVPWVDVNLISLRLSRLNFIDAFAELAELHPADLADVISQVGPRERAAVLGALNPQLAADTLEELEPELRTAAVLEMSAERALAVISEIDPDEAADLLAALPSDVAETLLSGLPAAEAASLRGLASHPEHSAGALMTTEFVSLGKDMTAMQAIARIRADRPEDEALSVIFLVDENGRLAGSLSLRDLVLADPGQSLHELMDDEVVRVMADTGEEEVGRLMTRYDLLALPVVDEAGRVIGIVTLDDALEAILPEEWKQRLPRLFR